MIHQYKTIVVAVDGSKEAELAFHKAVDIAKRNEDSALHILHIIEKTPVSSYEMLYENMNNLVHKHGEVLLEACKLYAQEQGLTNVQTIMTEGNPRSLLSKKLHTLVKADLIICGATGLNAIEQILLGSNTEAIVRHAPCDVLVVRTDIPEEE